MAITKILTINDCGRKFAGRHLQTAITYIIDPNKTQNMRYVTGINCQPEKAFDQMLATKQKFGKTDKRQGYHIIISFEEEDVEPGTAFEIIRKFAEEYLGQGYEAIYAVHDNTAHTHGHIIFNSKKSVVKIIKTGKKSVKVKACKSGTAYVTVRYKGKTKRCKIKVTAKKQAAPQADIPRLNATSVDIYHVDDALKPYMTVDLAHRTTFQFQVTGTKMEVEKWKVSTESGLVISDDGLLTTVWGPGYGTPYLTSTVTAILENNQRLTATVRVYAESNFYVDKVLTAFEQRNITSSMTGKEKVERAAAYIGETTD